MNFQINTDGENNKIPMPRYRIIQSERGLEPTTFLSYNPQRVSFGPRFGQPDTTRAKDIVKKTKNILT